MTPNFLLALWDMLTKFVVVFWLPSYNHNMTTNHKHKQNTFLNCGSSVLCIFTCTDANMTKKNHLGPRRLIFMGEWVANEMNLLHAPEFVVDTITILKYKLPIQFLPYPIQFLSYPIQNILSHLREQ